MKLRGGLFGVNVWGAWISMYPVDSWEVLVWRVVVLMVMMMMVVVIMIMVVESKPTYTCSNTTSNLSPVSNIS